MRYYACLFLLVSLSPSGLQAARIYQLVNYPDLQNGHTLSGTITTTDNAPDDSILEAEEILNWQWFVTGSHSFSRSLGPEATTRAHNISISASQIVLPLDSHAGLSFESLPPPDSPPDTPTLRLQWATYLGNPPPFLPSYAFGFLGRDAFIPYWQNSLFESNYSGWIVATAIPEPTSFILVLACPLGCSLFAFDSERVFVIRGPINC